MNTQTDLAKLPALQQIRTAPTLNFSRFKGLVQQAARQRRRAFG
jgi:hypothetical protein